MHFSRSVKKRREEKRTQNGPKGEEGMKRRRESGYSNRNRVIRYDRNSCETKPKENTQKGRNAVHTCRRSSFGSLTALYHYTVWHTECRSRMNSALNGQIGANSDSDQMIATLLPFIFILVIVTHSMKLLDLLNMAWTMYFEYGTRWCAWGNSSH